MAFSKGTVGIQAAVSVAITAVVVICDDVCLASGVSSAVIKASFAETITTVAILVGRARKGIARVVSNGNVINEATSSRSGNTSDLEDC